MRPPWTSKPPNTADGFYVKNVEAISFSICEREWVASLNVHSVLFPHEPTVRKDSQDQPKFFRDLNLDQIVQTIVSGRQEYQLEAFFYTMLQDVNAIHFRHQVMRDLEHEETQKCVRVFTDQMKDVRDHLQQVEKLYYALQKQSWLLDAVWTYCEAVTSLSAKLDELTLTSPGLSHFRNYIGQYVSSEPFAMLFSATRELKEDLACIHYAIFIKDNSVTVQKYDGEPDYSAKVVATFARFQQEAVEDYTLAFSNRKQMNHVEAQILERLSLLYPELFGRLENYCNEHQNFIDGGVSQFDREIQFYLAYLGYMSIFQNHGLKFCYPKVTNLTKGVVANGTYDAALAYKLIETNQEVVRNDFYLQDPERIFVVSGPNQGGKTTFARTFGQIHFLAGLGLPVPGREASLYLFDEIFTHFEREESMLSQKGKLQDDLIRIHAILNQASPNSLVIMNEIFSSTTLEDATILAKQVLKRVTSLDLMCVMVTFIDELASFSDTTVSLVSTVSPANPAVRTYKLVRKPADGLAYALSIAEKYGLTYEQLKGRVQP